MMKRIRRWNQLRPLRKVSSLMKVWIFIAGLIISIGSILTYVSIDSFCYNVIIPYDDPELKLNGSDIKSNHLSLPYKISNEGYFDIVDIMLKVQIDVVYCKNDSDKEARRTIFLHEESLKYIRPGEDLMDIFEGSYDDFDNSEILLFLEELDVSKEITRFLEIEISASLSGLVQIHIHYEDIDIDGE
jgi:hypothetical protein